MENLKLFWHCLVCWAHGFKVKTGTENFLMNRFRRENEEDEDSRFF